MKVPALTWYRRHKWATLVLTLTFLGVAFWGYQAYSQYNNEKSFKDARAAIDTIYADVIDKVGAPDNYKRTNDCSRPSGVYEDGPLSCSVGTSFIYGLNNQVEANSLFKLIQKTVADHQDLFKPSQPLATGIEDTLVVNTYYHSALDRFNVGGMNCVIKYVFDTDREIDLEVSNPSKKPLQINIGCSDFAKKEYYPLHR